MKFITTNDGFIAVIRGVPYTISSSHKNFLDLRKELMGSEDAFLELYNDTKKKIVANLPIGMKYGNGVISFLGEVLHGYTVDKLVDLIEAGKDTQALANFLIKIRSNPSAQVIEHLYTFLEKGDMPLTSSGNFLAYKAVRPDFTDIHSSTFKNTVGSFHRMQRNKVNDDRNVTCSYGFHVCSFGYLPFFSHADGHVMICEVNPADVVSIPNDHNDAKLRTCAYSVVGEHTGYYKDHDNVLSEIDLYEERYYVGDVEFDNYEDAYNFAQDELANGAEDVSIENDEEEVLFFEKNWTNL